MSLKPESLRPQEIASLCPKLLDGKSVEALVAVHAAIEELQASAYRLTPNPPIHTGGRREDSGRV